MILAIIFTYDVLYFVVSMYILPCKSLTEPKQCFGLMVHLDRIPLPHHLPIAVWREAVWALLHLLPDGRALAFAPLI